MPQAFRTDVGSQFEHIEAVYLELIILDNSPKGRAIRQPPTNYVARVNESYSITPPFLQCPCAMVFHGNGLYLSRIT